MDWQDIARFWGQVSDAGYAKDRCWEWRGARKSGKWKYGLFGVDNHEWTAHRFAYTLAFGAVPEGLIVRHKCDNPPCVNPFHLETGTNEDNVADRHTRGRDARVFGEANWNSKLTQQQVDYIKSQRGLQLQREIAAQFNITQNMVSKIQCGRSWNPEGRRLRKITRTD